MQVQSFQAQFIGFAMIEVKPLVKLEMPMRFLLGVTHGFREASRQFFMNLLACVANKSKNKKTLGPLPCCFLFACSHTSSAKNTLPFLIVGFQMEPDDNKMPNRLYVIMKLH